MRYLVALSGGIDSCTVLSLLLARAPASKVTCISFDYGSKHNYWENFAAMQIARYYSVEYKHIKVTELFSAFQSNLLKSGGPIPEGHYQDETMKFTVVPARNLIFASILAGYAESNGFGKIFLGVHQGDHAIYPDCRPEFIGSLQATVHLATDGKVQLQAPLLLLTKKEIVEFGLKCGAPYEFTRTCYKEQEIACGKCGSCRERLEAFKENDAEDQILYAKEN